MKINSLGAQNLGRRPHGRTRSFALSISCAVVLVTGAVSAQNAFADEFCVGPNSMPGCPSGATQYAASELGDAFAATLANGASSPDNVYVYSGRYESVAGFSASNSILSVVGVGPTLPVLAISGVGSHDGKTVLTSDSNSATFKNLAIEIPAANANVGIKATSGGTTIRNVEITGSGSSNATGIALGGSAPEIFSSSIDLPYASGASTAVRANAATSLSIRDLTVKSASSGLILMDSQNANIQRALVMAPRGIDLVDSPGAVVSSSLLRPAALIDGVAAGFSVRSSVTTGNASDAVNIFNSTLIGHSGTSSNGVVAESTNAGSEAVVNLDSSVIFGHDGAAATTNGGAQATINLSFSRYQGAVSGSGAFAPAASATQITGDPGFASASTGDFSLRRDSSLIDVGNPGSLAGGSDSDLAGNPRIVSRGGGNVRDIGAYEVLSRAPEPRIVVLSSAPTTTQPAVFAGSTSSDPDGDALAYSWRFDGTAFASGEVVSRQFFDPGLHTAELTVTDSTGRSEATLAQFNVERGFIAIKLRAQRVRTSARGRFSIIAACPDAATTNCSGRLILQTVKRIKRKPVRAASYIFSIEPGTKRKLTMQSYRSFQTALRRYKKLNLSVRVIDGSTTNAFVASKQSSISVLAPKKSKKRR